MKKTRFSQRWFLGTSLPFGVVPRTSAASQFTAYAARAAHAHIVAKSLFFMLSINLSLLFRLQASHTSSAFLKAKDASKRSLFRFMPLIIPKRLASTPSAPICASRAVSALWYTTHSL